MTWTAVPTRNPGDTIASADWNTYVRDNFASLAGLIMYYNGAAPSGTTEFTAARGLFICGLVSGGTLATAVGTPLTDQQNVSHTHTTPQDATSTQGGTINRRLIADNGSGPPSGSADVNVTQNTGGASAGSIGIPYLQLRVVSHS